MFLFAALVTSLLTSLTSCTETCPDPELLSPCTCTESFFFDDIDVHCRGGDLVDLQRPMEHLRGRLVTELVLEGAKLGKIPATFFVGMNVMYLHIRDCKMTQLVDHPDRKALDGLQNSLQHLRLINTIQGPVVLPSLKHLEELRVLEITKSNISTLHRGLMDKLPYKLEKLKLEDNGIQSIERDVMSNFGNLQSLELRRQNITSFNRDILRKTMSQLLTLDLSDCQLTGFPSGVFGNPWFEGMPKLRFVSISGNPFKNLYSNWASVWSQLDSFWAIGNEIQCDESMEWMFKMKRPRYVGATCGSGARTRIGKNLGDVIDAQQL